MPLFVQFSTPTYKKNINQHPIKSALHQLIKKQALFEHLTGEILTITFNWNIYFNQNTNTIINCEIYKLIHLFEKISLGARSEILKHDDKMLKNNHVKDVHY